MWIGIAFAALGFLVGNIVGLTSASVSSTLIGLLFAFAGGSAIAFMHKLDAAARREAALAIFGLSIACTVGIYFSVVATEHRWLSPIGSEVLTKEDRDALKVLRTSRVPASVLRRANDIDVDLANGRITEVEAYGELRSLLIEQTEPN